MMGAHINCVSENANNNQPLRLEALPVLTCSICFKRFGMTGMMMPQPITSINRVTKMKPMAALRVELILGQYTISLELIVDKAGKINNVSRQSSIVSQLFFFNFSPIIHVSRLTTDVFRLTIITSHLIIHPKQITFAGLFWKGY